MVSNNLEVFYPIEIRIDDDRYISEIKNLGIIHTANTPNEASAIVRAQLQSTIEKYRDIGATMPHEAEGFNGVVGNPGYLVQANSRSTSTTKLLGIALICALVIVPILFGVQVVGNYISKTGAAFSDKLALVEFRSVSDGIISVANQVEHLTPEREKQLVGAIQKLVAKSMPFRDAIDPLFKGSSRLDTEDALQQILSELRQSRLNKDDER
ncbi:MAG: hypothetical protein COA78_35735 [Blastopirellula sp.]|nr:MAG: hypothetical protein COA78_35735 [Blastopirellula sp.]